METSSLRLVLRYSLAAILGLAGLAILAPILARPDVAELAAECVKAAALVLVLASAILSVGYVHHRLQLWAADCPPAPAGEVSTFAYDLRHVAHMEKAADRGDELERWKSAIVKFTLLGNMCGFGWHDLQGLVDRPGWDVYKQLLVNAGVLELGAGRRPTDWAAEWSYCRFRVAVKFDRLSLPFPTGSPPAVRWARGYDVKQCTQTKHASKLEGMAVWKA